MTSTPTQWRAVPPLTTAIFLLAVFCIFASFGFVSDVMETGLEPPLRFALSVLLSGIFPVAYAYTGYTLRSKFWKAFLPLFAVHITCMASLGHFLPEEAPPAQLAAVAMSHLHNRLTFDGLATIILICLGYTGFVYVSISEGRRHGRMEMEKAVLEGEMSAAREVQRVMVPEDLPQVLGYAIESAYQPAAEVGGDFFQVIPLSTGRTLVVLGDVSGKGLRAAMIVAMIVGMLSSLSGSTEEPSEILDELNRRLYGRVHEGFVTCLVVRLEEKGSIALANAGHLPPYANGIEVPVQASLPLGLSPNHAYTQANIEIALGDAVVLLTDGVVEAQDHDRKLLGFSHVETMLRAGATARQLVDSAQLHGQNDDITVLRLTRVA